MRIPLAKTGIYACGVSQQTAVASAKPDTAKQEKSMTCRFIQVIVSSSLGKTGHSETGKLKACRFIQVFVSRLMFKIPLNNNEIQVKQSHYFNTMKSDGSE